MGNTPEVSTRDLETLSPSLPPELDPSGPLLEVLKVRTVKDPLTLDGTPTVQAVPRTGTDGLVMFPVLHPTTDPGVDRVGGVG